MFVPQGHSEPAGGHHGGGVALDHVSHPHLLSLSSSLTSAETAPTLSYDSMSCPALPPSLPPHMKPRITASDYAYMALPLTTFSLMPSAAAD